MKNLLVLSCLSVILGQVVYAAGTETVRCSLKLSYAGDKILDAKQKTISVKIEDNEGDLNLVLNKTTTENIDIAIESKENVKGLYGVSIRHWPTEKAYREQLSFGDILLMSEGTFGENEDSLSDELIPRPGKKADTILTLHPYAQLSNSLSALFITKQTMSALREVGYKGSSIVNNFMSFEALDGFVAQALVQSKLKKTDLVLFGFEGDCRLVK